MSNIDLPFRIGRSVIRRLRTGVGAFWRSLLGAEHSCFSYSQYGEDMLLRAIFTRFPPSYRGFYVDVGAHHPGRFSNTRYFYDINWNGICIDPLPAAKNLFLRYRPRDIFLPFGVCEEDGEMTYYMFDEPAMNTLSVQNAGLSTTGAKAEQRIRVMPLRSILNNHRPEGRTIDFISIDVEGLDLQVLRSNDWCRHRPRIVLIEENSVKYLPDIVENETAKFMKKNEYLPIACTPNALAFVDSCSPAYDGGLFLCFDQRPQSDGVLRERKDELLNKKV